jgi:FkbM family methyltransferase
LVLPRFIHSEYTSQSLSCHSISDRISNSLTNVECVHAVCGSTPGEDLLPDLRYDLPGDFGGFGEAFFGSGRRVRRVTLDDYAEAARIALVKIDVEGMESAVIAGALNLIRRHRPMLYVENDRRKKSAALIAQIQELGYRLYWSLPPLFNPNNWRGETADLWAGAVSVNMLCIPRECEVALAGHPREITSPQDQWNIALLGDQPEARKFHFEHVEKIDPVRGYPERPVSWFQERILPDLLATKRRLRLGPRGGDFGCAFGYFTKLLAEHFDAIVGVDYSEIRLAGARKYNMAPNVEYHQADLTTAFEKLSLVNLLGTFDWAITSAVIQHLPPAQRRNAFQQISGTLHSGSYLIMYDEKFDDRPNRWDGFYEPISPTWVNENISDILTLNACDFLCSGLGGASIYRYELQKR